MGNKGKNANKNKPKSKQQQHGKQRSSNASKKINPQQNKAQHESMQTKMIKCIDDMYSAHTQKHPHMRSFFGIFTKHNQLQLRVLMNASIPVINAQITDKFLKTTQDDECRDINGFIFHGDVPIGAMTTEITNGSKICWIRAFCVLPYFRNFGFGSRLLVNLIKNGTKRKKLQMICAMIDEKNTKGIAFFERFGFKKEALRKGQNEAKEQRAENKIKLTMDLRIFRASVSVLVNKQKKTQTRLDFICTGVIRLNDKNNSLVLQKK